MELLCYPPREIKPVGCRLYLLPPLSLSLYLPRNSIVSPAIFRPGSSLRRRLPPPPPTHDYDDSAPSRPGGRGDAGPAPRVHRGTPAHGSYTE
ncbi:hypothetical protein MUK42_28999 [Musa troglodytarum]|uniref:Uncharacterized protein n=1 Tax=Musa troglodytarum TaxID=320322 RepID=A0A9E7FN04_9LILI|nr:hypothetical protein MUK42_28999 [Musa troglodytarum]